MTQLGDAEPRGALSRLVLSDTGGFINDLSFEFDVSAQGTHGEGRASITPMMRSTGSMVRPSVIASTLASWPSSRSSMR